MHRWHWLVISIISCSSSPTGWTNIDWQVNCWLCAVTNHTLLNMTGAGMVLCCVQSTKISSTSLFYSQSEGGSPPQSTQGSTRGIIDQWCLYCLAMCPFWPDDKPFCLLICSEDKWLSPSVWYSVAVLCRAQSLVGWLMSAGRHATSNPKVNSAFHPSGVSKSSTNLSGWD